MQKIEFFTYKISSFLLIFFLITSCGVPQSETLLDPPRVDVQLDNVNTNNATFYNQDYDNTFYPNEFRGFNFYYRIYDDSDTSIQNPENLDIYSSANYTVLKNYGVNYVSKSVQNSTYFSYDSNNSGYRGYYRLFTADEYDAETSGIALTVDNVTLNNTVEFDFDCYLENDTVVVKYTYNNGTTNVDKTLNLYRLIQSQQTYDVTEQPRLRTFKGINGFRITDNDLKGAEGSVDSSVVYDGADIYVAFFIAASGLTNQYAQLASKVEFLGLLNFNIDLKYDEDEDLDLDLIENYN